MLLLVLNTYFTLHSVTIKQNKKHIKFKDSRSCYSLVNNTILCNKSIGALLYHIIGTYCSYSYITSVKHTVIILSILNITFILVKC